jgi:hypothetical protein
MQLSQLCRFETMQGEAAFVKSPRDGRAGRALPASNPTHLGHILLGQLQPLHDRQPQRRPLAARLAPRLAAAAPACRGADVGAGRRVGQQLDEGFVGGGVGVGAAEGQWAQRVPLLGLDLLGDGTAHVLPDHLPCHHHHLHAAGEGRAAGMSAGRQAATRLSQGCGLRGRRAGQAAASQQQRLAPTLPCRSECTSLPSGAMPRTRADSRRGSTCSDRRLLDTPGGGGRPQAEERGCELGQAQEC